MTVTLEDFEIINGDSRIHQAAENETLTMEQQTQTAPPARGEWKVGYPSRAQRSVRRSFVVGFPECASVADAVFQQAFIPAECPKGGVLVEYHEGSRITYAYAWVSSIRCERLVLRNFFTFELECTNPTIEALIIDGTDGEIITDGEDDEELTY